jgi:hemolysin III
MSEVDGPERAGEEAANTITHALGVVASAAATGVLVTLSARSGSVWHIVGSVIFGASLLLLYTASTLYHAARSDAARRRLQILDHCAIYLLIAGSYTPFTLAGLGGRWGWSLFGVIWGLAAAGVVFKLFFTGRFRRTSTAIYIAMGWLCVVAARPMMRSLAPATLVWLVAGGVAYTAGTVFYTSRRRYAHAVWHMFVLAGSACHVIAAALQIQKT